MRRTIACVIAAASFAWGGDTAGVAELDPMLVSATRSEIGRRDAPVIAYVVDSAAMSAVRAAHVSEALAYVPGIDIGGGTGVGLPSKRSITVNGLPSFHSIVLVDGHRLLSSHFHTGANIDIVPPSAIERIEIVKDASSALYGSDALGGVVNIITKRGTTTPALDLSFAGGGQQTLRGSLSLRGSSGPKLLHSVYAGWDQSEGLPITEGKRKDQLEFKQLSLLDRFDYLASSRVRVGGSVHYAGFMDLQSGSAFYNAWLLTPSVDFGVQATPHFTINGQAYYTRWDADLSNERNELASPELYVTYSGLPYNQLSAGGDFQWRNFARDGVLEQDQRLVGAFLQDQLTLLDNRIRVLGAVRVDYVDNTAPGSEDNGPEFSPRISAVVRPIDALSIRAGVGKGFRAPYVQDLYESRYHPSGGGIWRYGNSQLEPEHSIGTNGGIEWRLPAWLGVGVNGYYNSLTDMIALVRGTRDSAGVEVPRDTAYGTRRVPVWQRQNINDYRIGGFEGWLRIDTRHIGAYAGGSATWQESDDADAAEALLYPGRKVFATVSGRGSVAGSLEINGFAGVQYVFDRTAPGGVGSLSEYVNLEAGLGLVFKSRLEWFVKGSNLLGQEIDMFEDALWTAKGIPMWETGLKVKAF